MTRTIGWVGTGRMGQAMAARLLGNGCDLVAFNRTVAKLEPLLAAGARGATRIAELAPLELVFITVGADRDLLDVLDGDGGLLRQESSPQIIVDCSTVSEQASIEARGLAEQRGTVLLCAPVSGNPKVATAGRLTMAVSGPKEAFDKVEPYLRTICAGVTYVGDGETARLVKLCHNLMLGAVIQSLIEVTLLAENAGVRRQDFLAFLNDSVLGSTFTRYKSPALVKLEFAPTFTTRLLRKDIELGLQAAREFGLPMPVSAAVHEVVQTGVGSGIGDVDFAALIEVEARAAGMGIASEDGEVPDGLSAKDEGRMGL